MHLYSASVVYSASVSFSYLALSIFTSRLMSLLTYKLIFGTLH